MSHAWKSDAEATDTLGWLAVTGAVAFLGGAGVYMLASSTLGARFAHALDPIFALSSVQVMWYITRASGLMAYFLLWLSTVWGLAVSSKFLDRMLHRSFTYDYHQFLSLLAIGFVALHVGILMFDRYLPYTLAQILVPFLSPYRPLWVGLGVISLYLILLVTVTFYMRSRIGSRAFRTIHVLSLVAYLGVAAHALFAGTDSALWFTRILYASTFLVTVFLTTYWLMINLQRRLGVLLSGPQSQKRVR
jgi:predicted ferric reductase